MLYICVDEEDASGFLTCSENEWWGDVDQRLQVLGDLMSCKVIIQFKVMGAPRSSSGMQAFQDRMENTLTLKMSSLISRGIVRVSRHIVEAFGPSC